MNTKTRVVWTAIGIIALVITIGIVGFIYVSPEQNIFPHERGIGTQEAQTTQEQTAKEQLTVRFSSTGAVHNAQMTVSGSYATSYLWDFGDGTTSTERDPVHAYEKSGTYQVTLTIVLETGEKYTESTEIKVG